jgi:molybdopterin molybdotransferase
LTDRPLPWVVARSRSYDVAHPLTAQRRPLEQCAGTCLAAALVAAGPLPAFDVAAMDGYAVAGAGPWQLVGEVLAGSTWDRPLATGTAVVVGTGARLPAGTDAVLQVEHAQRRGDRVHGEVAAGRHVRRTGEECAQGDPLLPTGTPVTARVLGLAAASGADELQVTPRPRVLALVTGDELLADGLPRDGRVRDALGPQLPGLVAAAGGDVVGRSYLPDDRALLRAAIDAADADVVVTTGASSVGPADHLRPVLAELGADVLVDGVACRPGHPQLLARLPGGRFAVGLPGNPLAALVAAATVLQPLLAGLGGRPLRTASALLAEPLRASASDTRLVPVRVEGLRARPVPHTGSGMLRGAALADALAVVPPGADLPAGAEVELLPLA